MDSVNATSGLQAASGAAQPKASAAQQPRNPKLWKAANDFQEVMLSQFTQAMRSTDKDNSLFEECPGRETFDQMFSDAIAHQMSQSGALGLNKTIYRAMGGTFDNSSVAAGKLGSSEIGKLSRAQSANVPISQCRRFSVFQLCVTEPRREAEKAKEGNHAGTEPKTL